MVWTYMRVHRTTGDCQNPVERTQAAVGKAFANGDRIHWEYKTMLSDLTKDEKEKMSPEDFILEIQRRKKKYNVLETCKDLGQRVQDAPGPRGSLNPMTGLVSSFLESPFF